MIEFPKGVRLAQAGDEKRVFDLCCIAHGENGWGEMDPATVQDTIRKATSREGCVIAIIDGPERVEAQIGLRPAKLWYCSDAPQNWYWTDLFFYVHPLHRRSRHAAKLFQFAKWWEQQIKQPVVLELMPREDFEEKDKLFSRFGKRVGSSFVIGEIGAAAVTSNARH